MNKIDFRLFTLLLALIVAGSGLTSCGGDDDADQQCYFRIQCSDVTVTDETGRTAVESYATDLMAAYRSALGMSKGSNILLVDDSDYYVISSIVKSRFVNATLPDAPKLPTDYTFTITLYGAPESNPDPLSVRLIALREFTSIPDPLKPVN